MMTKFFCNLTDAATLLTHFWEHTVGSDHAPVALRADWQSQLRRCRDELGFRHVRFHGLLSDDLGTLICHREKFLYSFFNADQIFDFLLSTGMKPFVELSFQAFSRPPHTSTAKRMRSVKCALWPTSFTAAPTGEICSGRKGKEDMQPLDLNDFIEFNDRKVNPVVLANEPDMRLLLLCMRAGQRVPEHSAAGSITVQSVTGRATFYDGEEACEMFAGSLVRLEAGRPHRVEAHTDAALLVTMVKPSKVGESRGEGRAAEREIDLCLMERPERHPLVFAAFDRLAVGESLVIHNDHDPQPLRMQIEQMRQGEVSWEYLERGPDTFRIRITRVAPPTADAAAERRRGNEARVGGDN